MDGAEKVRILIIMLSSLLKLINFYLLLFFKDDDVYKRCMKYFGKIKRLKPDIGRYFANCHEKDEHENTIRYELLKNSDARMKQDGLNSLDYRVLKVFKNKLFTLFHVYYQKNSQVLP